MTNIHNNFQVPRGLDREQVRDKIIKSVDPAFERHEIWQARCHLASNKEATYIAAGTYTAKEDCEIDFKLNKTFVEAELICVYFTPVVIRH